MGLCMSVEVSGVRWWCWWRKRGTSSLSVMMEGCFPFSDMFCVTHAKLENFIEVK